ncbi:MAG: hypothetical protein CME65_08285 [Halobacteriovoraceae bacterium]|nr:hypothetical protein [Halobacteriovoraceae bacterium]|tara:strand:+ start:1678 stop:1989 length:312 start_codon:yes stop_codon:yes gene_type:complete
MTITSQQLFQAISLSITATCGLIYLYLKLRQSLRERYIYRKTFELMNKKFELNDYIGFRNKAYWHYDARKTAWTDKHEIKYHRIVYVFTFFMMILVFMYEGPT